MIFKPKLQEKSSANWLLNYMKRSSGKEAKVPTNHPFADTRNPNIAAANKLGIVNGVGNNRFLPNGIASREEVSVMLYNTLKAAKPEYGFKSLNGHVFRDQK